MSSLFHYTTINGLRGILRSGNIWATHLGFLNDLSEGRAAMREDDEAYRERLQEIDRQTPVFIASFCRHEEPHQMRNGLLSQWRGYAGMGGGYCVELDEGALDKLVDEEKDSASGVTLLKKDIHYVGEEWMPDGEADEGQFFDLVAFTKDEAFREENESRIMLAVPHGGPRPIQFRDAGEMLIPFVEVFAESRSLPITGIIVGPGPLQKRCAAGVVQYLRAHDIGIPVRLSEIPLVR